MKVLNSKITLLLISFNLLTSSCKDIIEQDISQLTINMISPSENQSTSKYNVTFWWDDIDKIQGYHLQIVSPSFDSLQSIFIDTITSENKLNIIFQAGRYQWRLRGENGSSKTNYRTGYIIVDTNSDLTSQKFVVGFPTDNYYTTKNIISYNWDAYPFADKYYYILTDTSNLNIKLKYTNTTSISDTLAEGTYYWKVQAINSQNNTMTNFSTLRKITVDITPPLPPTLTSPANNGQATNPIQITWQRESADILGDSIYVSQDSLFQSIIKKAYTDQPAYSLPDLNIGNTYYWKVKSKDNASNWSSFSSIYSFTVL